MDEKTKKFSFRNSIGGFNKSDVVEYISEENKRFADERAEMESRLEESRGKIEESERRLFDAQRSFNELVQIKEREIVRLGGVIGEKDKSIGELNSQLTAVTADRDALSDEVAKLRALLNGCNEQIKEYAERVETLESERASRASSDGEMSARTEDLKRENAYLKEKYIKLQNEYDALHTRYESEAKAEPKKTGQHTAGRADCAGRDKVKSGKAAVTRRKEDVEDISEKAIDTIKAINTDVRSYMNSCVGEFDTYTRDVTVGISKLLEEIAAKCRELEARISKNKSDVSDSIDSKFNDFKY